MISCTEISLIINLTSDATYHNHKFSAESLRLSMASFVANGSDNPSQCTPNTQKSMHLTHIGCLVFCIHCLFSMLLAWKCITDSTSEYIRTPISSTNTLEDTINRHSPTLTSTLIDTHIDTLTDRHIDTLTDTHITKNIVHRSHIGGCLCYEYQF